MPEFDATAADQDFDFLDGVDDIDFSAEILRTTTTYVWDTSTGHRVTAHGDFSAAGPLTGKVSDLDIDLGTDADQDITVTMIPDVDINLLLAGHSSFWESLFAQDDAFELPSGQVNALSGDFVGGGDGVQGGDDEFQTSGGGDLTWVGDHHVAAGDITTGGGGDDDFEINGALTGAPEVHGDINRVFTGVTYTGGRDVIEFSNPGNFAGNAYGDARIVNGDLTGGDDEISGARSAYGDARGLVGGRLTGGDDTIVSTSLLSAFGDVQNISSSPTVSAIFTGGDDMLTGGASVDRLYGDFEQIQSGGLPILPADIVFGDDVIDGGAQDDDIYGDYRIDHAGILAASAGGNDELHGGPGDDDMFGNGGNDRIAPDDGDDAVDGGAGADTLDYSPDTMGVTIDLGAGTASGVWAGTDTFSNMEHVTTGSGADAITGDGARNIVNAGAGADTVDGLGGDDLVNGGGGDDVITGGDGENVLRGQAHDDHVTGGGEADEIAGGDGLDTLIGGAGGDDILGQGDADDIMGGAGDDELRGGQGDDVISGEDDDDLLFGGTGDDTLIGGAGGDFYVFALGYGADQVNDFADDADALRLNENLWGGGLTVAQVIAQFASQQGAHTVFDFGGGDALTVLNTTTAIFQDDIVFV